MGRLQDIKEAIEYVNVEAQQAQQAQHGYDRSSVMVTGHRLPTKMDADTVAVVQAGSLVGSGAHGSLMAAGGGHSQLGGGQLVWQ
ncbi:hypothetical protein COO60DRAFT_1634141 [Scenedesmus sp. NREL 46B-D3]|nr:hypothetical protein COO60DRAFT_1634141 [Scenedesmus sp. NREL 46B-D3]